MVSNSYFCLTTVVCSNCKLGKDTNKMKTCARRDSNPGTARGERQQQNENMRSPGLEPGHGEGMLSSVPWNAYNPAAGQYRENREEHICEPRPAILSLLEWPLKVLGFAPSVQSTREAEPDLEAAVSATPDGTWTQTSRELPAHQARFPQVTLQEQIQDTVIILPCAQPVTLASSLQPWEPTAGRRVSKAPPARVPPSLA